jgi:quinoprotein glucose dehydrogenase
MLRSHTTRATVLSFVAALAAAGAHAQNGRQQERPYTTWRTYGGGGHSSQYSALDQINKSNVTQLTVA